VVERREASAPQGARRAREGAAVVEQRFSAFRFPFCSGLHPRMIVMSPVPPPAASDEDHAGFRLFAWSSP
jgi:hypothetical protein